MTLSAGAILSFKEIYARQFGEQLLDAEAEQMGLKMLRLLRVIYSESAPKCWQEELKAKYERPE